MKLFFSYLPIFITINKFNLTKIKPKFYFKKRMLIFLFFFLAKTKKNQEKPRKTKKNQENYYGFC